MSWSSDSTQIRVPKVILSLCDYSGNWPRYYRPKDGYEVICIDIKDGFDVRWFHFIEDRPVHGILCAPPCTAFARSGATYWPEKDSDGRTLEGLAVVDSCLRAVAVYKPVWWALENPVGRLRRWLGPPAFSFDPCDYAGWNDNPNVDAYTKRTLLWGTFKAPVMRPVDPLHLLPTEHPLMRLGGSSERTKELRSTTPLGFSKAFRAANP